MSAKSNRTVELESYDLESEREEILRNLPHTD